MKGAKRTHVSRTIVEVETDSGLLGVGETRGEWSASIINERFSENLIGLPVGDEAQPFLKPRSAYTL